MSDKADIVERLRMYMREDALLMDNYGQSITEAADEIERLRKLNTAYWQEVESWRTGDGMGDFRCSMRDVPSPDDRPYSDEALWSYENEGCKLYTDACRKEAGL